MKFEYRYYDFIRPPVEVSVVLLCRLRLYSPCWYISYSMQLKQTQEVPDRLEGHELKAFNLIKCYEKVTS